MTAADPPRLLFEVSGRKGVDDPWRVQVTARSAFLAAHALMLLVELEPWLALRVCHAGSGRVLWRSCAEDMTGDFDATAAADAIARELAQGGS